MKRKAIVVLIITVVVYAMFRIGVWLKNEDVQRRISRFEEEQVRFEGRLDSLGHLKPILSTDTMMVMILTQQKRAANQELIDSLEAERKLARSWKQLLNIFEWIGSTLIVVIVIAAVLAIWKTVAK